MSKYLRGLVRVGWCVWFGQGYNGCIGIENEKRMKWWELRDMTKMEKKYQNKKINKMEKNRRAVKRKGDLGDRFGQWLEMKWRCHWGAKDGDGAGMKRQWSGYEEATEHIENEEATAQTDIKGECYAIYSLLFLPFLFSSFHQSGGNELCY